MATTAIENKPTRPMILTKRTKHAAPVVWAIDSSKLNEAEVKRMKNLLEAFHFESNQVFPTSVFSPFDLGWLIPVDRNLRKKTLERVSEKIKEQWAQFSINFKKNGLLVAENNSSREKVMSLIRFAKRRKARMIVVGTGASHRNNLTGLGSFSESLISMSPIPVLVVGENTKPIQNVTKVLFPTDYSEEALAAFKKALPFINSYAAEIVLYHHLNLEAGPIAYGIPWGLEMKWLDEYWRVQQEVKEKEGHKWKALAEKKGIKCSLLNDRKVGLLPERILENAVENQVDFISLPVTRGPWSQVLLGRNVRELFSKSTCPILTLHSFVGKRKLHS